MKYLISHEKNQLENTLKSEDRDEERDGAEEMSTGYRIYSDDPASKMQGENHESGLIKHIDFEGYEKVLEFILKSEAINGYIFDLGDIETRDRDYERFEVFCKELIKSAESWSEPRFLILISNLATWAKTKNSSPDAEEGSGQMNDFDFRKRKPHANFKRLFECEKTVLKLNKRFPNLNAIVLGSGVTYGHEESIFHHFFKTAWEAEQQIPIFGDGSNLLPTVHVDDLALMTLKSMENIQNISKDQPYLLCLDESKPTLRDIINSIATKIGSVYNCEMFPREEIYLVESLSQCAIDLLFLNLDLDGFYLRDMVDGMRVYEGGLIDNIDRIGDEFTKTRNLGPVRICVLGPPGIGKTFYAQKLQKEYKLPYLESQQVVEYSIQKLKKILENPEELSAAQSDEQKISKEEAAEILEQVEEGLELHGKIYEHLETRFFRDMFEEAKIRNRGYILDGFPRTQEQAKHLFEIDSNQDAGDEAEQLSKKPDILLVLQASDEFLAERLSQIPESDPNFKYTEKDFTSHLINYRQVEKSGDLLGFFDEMECYAEILDVEKHSEEEIKLEMQKIKILIGPPKNYGLTQEEIEQSKMAEEADRQAREEQERLATEKLEQERKEYQKQKEIENKNLQEKLDIEKQKEKEAMSLPIRGYLNKFVLPKLQQALKTCYEVKPENPIDFVAEHLLKGEIDLNEKKLEQMTTSLRQLGITDSLECLLTNF